jgi:ketosteroid isomerase-like protein
MNVALEAALVAFLFVTVAVCGVDSRMHDAAAELAALVASDRTRVDAFNAADLETAAGLYDERAVLMLPGAPPARGRAWIRALLAKDMAASAGIAVVLDGQPDGSVDGDVGWVSGTYTARDRFGRAVGCGSYLSVAKKKDGKWFFVRDTWNSGNPARLVRNAAKGGGGD